jgi:hypothetical protein
MKRRRRDAKVFTWKSSPIAVTRIREAVGEIERVAGRSDVC